MRFALALIASFLPSRQRCRWGLESSALLERAAFCGALLQTFVLASYCWRRIAQHLVRPEDPLSLALLVVHEIAADPVALLCALLAAEGVLRALIILGMNEIYPSLALALPLGLLSRLAGTDGFHDPPRREFTLYRRREDRIEQVGDKLVVATARLKPEWNDAAVCYAGLFYKAGGPHSAQHGLPYTYVLRPWPTGIVIRKTQYYDGPGFTFDARKNRAS